MTLHAIFPAEDRAADRRAADAVHRLGLQLVASLSIACVLLESGRDVDLLGLQDSVGELCARTLDLPHAIGVELLGLLEALRTQVDRARLALEAQTIT